MYDHDSMRATFRNLNEKITRGLNENFESVSGFPNWIGQLQVRIRNSFEG